MKIITKFVDDKEFMSVNEAGNVLAIDMYPPEEKKNFSPTEMLLSALSSCSSVDLVQMLKKRKKTITALTVEAEGVRREENPMAFTRIKLTFIVYSPDVEQAEFEKMGHLAATKYCSVADTLNIQAEHEFKIVRPE